MERLYLGINSHVICINKADGTEVWKTKLKRSTVTNVCYENDRVFAYSGGHLFCLDVSDGTVIWENALKGMGFGTCIIASEHQSNAVINSQVATQQTVAATSVAATVSTNAGS
ncbi:PQQ-binding-like beta-propeller repeat protein [Shewanella waksmanii]|uniref:outer membrane protein assembly factor BamB family protein n=1 Tax=Shewanella waksmanii TaxID=213783 RepID=UPI000490960E|nr:PQQ-binding-like beta-propeller repeat protein [Shewanella waksmanii]